MGTRGICGFVVNGEEKLTYNHWDSYPSGLGVSILSWLRSLNEDTLPEARERAAGLRLVDDQAVPSLEDKIQLSRFADTTVGGPATNTEITSYYQLLRKTQGCPWLNLEAGVMIESADFAYDGLFCEWAYVVDFDESTFEVYSGFRRQAPTEGRWATPERVAHEQQLWDAQRAEDKARGSRYEPPRYYAVQRVASWSLLGGLPDEAGFLDHMDKVEKAISATEEAAYEAEKVSAQ